MKRSLAWSAGLLVAILALSLPTLADEARDAARYNKLAKKIRADLERGNHARAIDRYERQAVLAPANSAVHYNMACSLSLAGRTDEALDALARAAELGSVLGEQARQDKDLESLMHDPRFETIVERLEANERAWEEAGATRHRELDPASAERYETLSQLTAAFANRRTDLRARRPLMNWTDFNLAEWEQIDQRVAALTRYLQDHPDAPDLELASLDRMRQSVGYHAWRDAWGVADGMFAHRQARQFLDAFPDSKHAPEALLQAGQARLLARAEATGDEAESESAAVRTARLDEADHEFAALITDYVGTAEATKACMWRMRTAYERAGKQVTPEVEEHYRAFCTACGEDESILDYAWQKARGPLFELEADKFKAVDLEGKEWTRETMAGKVVLVDFWATWCAPCMQELPNLKEAYRTYSDQGFEILGISLDGDDRDAFVASLAEHGIVWPQVYDGKGWSAELARQYRINGIPATVLVNRDGTVADIDLRGKKLIERVAELVSAR